MSEQQMREQFEEAMRDELKVIVGSADPYPAGLERDYWRVWQAAWNRRSPSPGGQTEAASSEWGAIAEQTVPMRKAEHVLADLGIYAGHTGLRGLANADEFWEQQPYGTRLYFGGGYTDYLHRSILQTAVAALDMFAASPLNGPSDETSPDKTDGKDGNG